MKKFYVFITIFSTTLVSLTVLFWFTCEELISHMLNVFIAIGTIGAVAYTLFSKKIEHEENLLKLRSNIVNEIFINFDQMGYNSLNERNFKLLTNQINALLTNTNLVNIEAEGMIRKLILMNTSFENFNLNYSNRPNWREINRDIIKCMLILFWTSSITNFEEDEKQTLPAIHKLLDSKFAEQDFKDFKHSINNKLLSFNNFSEYIPNLSNKILAYDDLIASCQNEIDIKEKQKGVEQFIIHKLLREWGIAKDRIKTNLNKDLATLIN